MIIFFRTTDDSASNNIAIICTEKYELKDINRLNTYKLENK